MLRACYPEGFASVKPVEYHIHIYQNAAFSLKATYSDADKNPIDLSAYSGEFVIRRSMESPEAVLRSTNITFGSAQFNVVLALTATETDELPTKNIIQPDWVFELQIWDPADEENTRMRLVEGRCTVVPSAGRPDNS